MFIEFIGIPGAGKSTLARQTVSLLKCEGFVVRLHAGHDPHRLTANRLSARRRNLRRLADLAFVPRLGAACVGRLRSGRYQAFVLLARMCHHEAFRRRHFPGGVHVFEEGALLPLSKLAGLPASRGLELHGLLAHLTLPDLIVHVNVPASVALDRVRQREGRIAIDRLSDDAALHALELHRSGIQRVLPSVTVPVLTLDTIHGDARAVVSAIRQQLVP